MAAAVGFPFGAAGGIVPGTFAGFGMWSGWAIAFLVLFFVGWVIWSVWGSVGPLVRGAGALGTGGFFW
ncbi:MAG TPA: hypothetical protein VFV52_07655 [Bacilli bacterium]|nr:hypothetical protein [Bacilli bacterium]